MRRKVTSRSPSCVGSTVYARFFTLEPDGNAYRVHKGIRDLLVFSAQDVLGIPVRKVVIQVVAGRNIAVSGKNS